MDREERSAGVGDQLTSFVISIAFGSHEHNRRFFGHFKQTCAELTISSPRDGLTGERDCASEERICLDRSGPLPC
jgi:hypothetical protein